MGLPGRCCRLGAGGGALHSISAMHRMHTPADRRCMEGSRPGIPAGQQFREGEGGRTCARMGASHCHHRASRRRALWWVVELYSTCRPAPVRATELHARTNARSPQLTMCPPSSCLCPEAGKHDHRLLMVQEIMYLATSHDVCPPQTHTHAPQTRYRLLVRRAGGGLAHRGGPAPRRCRRPPVARTAAAQAPAAR